jgi:hypothetical protein
MKISTPKSTATKDPTTAVKTASKRTSVEEAIASALDELSATTKEASVSEANIYPENDLRKLAGEVATTTMLEREAQMAKLGMIFADAVVARIGAHTELAEAREAEKMASLGLEDYEIAMINEFRQDPAQFVAKMASLHESMNEQIVEETTANTVREIHKLATMHAAEGYAAIADILRG